MDKAVWYKKKKGVFYILLLFQTGVILFIAFYIVVVLPYLNNYKNYNNDIGLAQKKLSDQRKSILMFIAILSAPTRIQRRDALRRSWLRQCKQLNTACYIFTDSLDTYGKRLHDEIMVALEQEQFLNKDLILTESPGGVNFATRYLWVIKWANRNYKFDFLLRVDDDYFICMDRLFLELPQRKVIRKLYWGYIHCAPAGNFGELKRLSLLLIKLIIMQFTTGQRIFIVLQYY